LKGEGEDAAGLNTSSCKEQAVVGDLLWQGLILADPRIVRALRSVSCSKSKKLVNDCDSSSSKRSAESGRLNELDGF
jgi:hypothetical protein